MWFHKGRWDPRDGREALVGMKALWKVPSASGLVRVDIWYLSRTPRFEQEVLGAPVTGIPTAVPAVPTVEAMQVPPAPVIRPIIATNTYQQVRRELQLMSWENTMV